MFFIFSYVIFGFAFAGFMIYSYLYLFISKKKSYDFIIIHGAGLLGGEKITPLLKHRIDKAVEAYHKSVNPKLKSLLVVVKELMRRFQKLKRLPTIYCKKRMFPKKQSF